MSEYKRWYDHDPLLIEVIEILKYFQDDLKEQAQIFIDKIESQVGKESIDSFYKMIHSFDGNRWYDKDPVLSKAIELLRVVPPQYQRKAAQNFLDSLNKKGINLEIITQED